MQLFFINIIFLTFKIQKSAVDLEGGTGSRPVVWSIYFLSF